MVHKALGWAEECQRVLGARLRRALSYTSTGLDLISWHEGAMGRSRER